MGIATQGIVLIKTKHQCNTRFFFSGNGYKKSFEELGSPDVLDTYEKNYVVASFLDDESDFSQEYIALCKKLVSKNEVEEVTLCELTADYGIYISQFVDSKQTPMWSMDDCDNTSSSVSPSLNIELMKLFPCGGYDLGKIDSYIKALSKVKEYTPEKIKKGGSSLTLDYGKEDIRDKTAVIRFHIVDKPKREKLFKFWDKYRSMDSRPNLDDVSKDFTPLFYNAFLKIDLKWCSWAGQYCLHELIYGIQSVTIHKNFIYVCFDTSVVPNMPKEEMSDPLLNLVYLMSDLDGVKKVWIKVRPASRYSQELYTCWPMSGDWPWALEVDLTTDDTWNKLTG